jgi:hypothetical protein
MKSRWTNVNVFAVVFCLSCMALSLRTDVVYADDFGRIVHHIEASYHVHRNYRFLFGFAGMVVRCWHVGGVKSLKMAYFENQHLEGTDTDNELDEIIAHAGESGWRPVVRSVSRRSGEHVYIYAQDADAGKNLKVLVVNVEPNEAEVIQVKVDPKKLEQFIDENMHHRAHSAMDGVMTFR